MLSRSILVFAILPFATFAASRGKWCEVSQSVESQLADIKSSPLLTPAQRAGAEKQITHLLARYPGNLFVYLRDQSITKRAAKADRQAMIARYRKLMAAHPNDPLYQFLYAHALLDVNTPQSIQIAKKLLAENPDFARTHVLLANAYSWGKFANHAEALRQIGAFFGACPGALDSEALSLAGGLAGQKLAAKILPPIETRLSKATDQQELEFWQHVWPLEFTARPVTEDAALRKQIAAQLTRMKNLHLKENAKWLDFLRDGYHIAGDESASHQMAKQLLAEYPKSFQAREFANRRWQKQHPWPGSDPKKQAIYWKAALQRADANLKESPDDGQFLWDRFQALSKLKSTPTEQLSAAGEAVVSAFGKPQSFWIVPPPEFSVAQTFLKRKTHEDEVPKLVAQGLANYRRASGFHSDRQMIGSGNDAFLYRQAALILLDAATQLHQPDLAKAAVAKTRQLKLDKPYEKSQQYEIDGKWAELEGHKLDALLYYRASIESRPANFKPGKDDKTAASENRLWKELGGTDATKKLLAENAPKVRTAQAGGWEKPKKTMPPWKLTDLHGKTWALKKLEGKAVLINVWATWCGPCNAEHPYLQKLYNRLKNNPHIQIVTFDVDDNSGEVAPYMKEHHYTFPVLLAKSYVGALISEVAIPQNWIVNPQGVWVWKELGFSGDQWEANVTKKLKATK